MKKLLSIIAIVAIVVSSCTSSKNSLVLKRKYSKGFYVSHKHKTNKEELAVINTENKTTTTANVHTETKTKLNVSVINAVKEEVVAYKKNEAFEAKATANELKHNTILVETKNETASIHKTKTKVNHSSVNTIEKAEKPSSNNSDQILLIILSLFPILALIAIYLKDRNQITLNFWVDLLLHFIFLYWLFAILVVLDIINLG